MKKIIALFLTITMMFSFIVPVMADEEIKVTVNDKQIVFTEKPVMESDRILVPIRAIAEEMQFDVGWEQSTQEIKLENFNTILTLFVNQNTINKELKFASDTYDNKNSSIEIDVPAKIIDDRTYIPLRAITELFGATVNWDQSTSTANIIYNTLYGDTVTFEDEGMEFFCRLAITLEGIDVSDRNNIDEKFMIKIESDKSDLYNGPIYENAIKDITTIGINTGYSFIHIVNSLKDISKFPNLENIYLLGQNITDLSPITYKKTWNNIDVYRNPIFDFSPLTQVTVNHSVYTGYFDYLFSYINEDYVYGEDISAEAKEKYDLFAENLAKMFKTMQDVIKNNITEDMTTSEKIKVINDWIISNIKYDTDSQYFNSIPHFYTTLDDQYTQIFSNIVECAILHKYAICEGYSTVFDIFCDMLNIPSIFISGEAYNGEWEAHAWNIVKLEDGNLYHVDTTFNCTRNVYLLITDSEIEIDHKWNSEDVAPSFDYKKRSIHFLKY